MGSLESRAGGEERGLRKFMTSSGDIERQQLPSEQPHKMKRRRKCHGRTWRGVASPANISVECIDEVPDSLTKKSQRDSREEGEKGPWKGET